MPYMLSENGLCVHKKLADGSLGEKIKCHDNHSDALAQMQAMNIAMAGKADMSMEDKQRAVNKALEPYRDPNYQSVSQAAYVEKTFDDYVILSLGSLYYQADYTMTSEGTAILSPRDQWKPMSQEWVAKFKATSRNGIKAVGNYELDVLAIPFDSHDLDGQWFDSDTNIMPESFQTPAVIYQHSVDQGAKRLQARPVVIGKSVAGSLEKKSDGWHIKVILDKANKLAQGVIEAVKKGMVAVSSGTIDHLARLDVGGKLIPYDKNKAGRIAIWPFAEISLWEKGNGNFNPANRFAVAMPAMKAIYKDAGLRFPEIEKQANSLEAGKAARVAKVQAESKKILARINKY